MTDCWKHALRGILSLVLVTGSLVPLVAQENAAEKITYDDNVKPVLVQRCGSCHNGQKKEGALDVTNYLALMEGGGSGAVIEPLDASASYLYQLVTHQESPEMPPSGTKIPDPEIQLLASWINMGALENKGSQAAKPKPKLDMSLAENPTARPEVVPTPLRIPLEPVIKPERPSVLALATSPWAPVVAVSTPRQILLYNSQSLELAGVLPMPEGGAHSLKFSRNGQLLVAGGGKDGALGRAFIFNARTGERITTVGDELESVLAADISPNQEYVAIGGPNKLVKLFYTDGTLIAEIKKHTDWVTALEFSPDGLYLATGDRNGGVHVWDAETGNPVADLRGHTGLISQISWRPDSKFLATSSEDTAIKVWQVEEWKQVGSWGAHGGGVTGMEFRRDGHIVSTGRDKVAKLWEQGGKMVTQYAGLPDVAVAVTHCDETDRVFAADWTGQLKVWNGPDAAHLADLPANPPRLAERLAASETALASANQQQAPLVEQLNQTKTTVDTMNKALAEVQQSMAAVEARLATETEQAAQAKAAMDAVTARLTQEQAELTAKSTAQPMVAASLQKAKEAVAALPADEALQQAATTLEQKAVELGARVTELTGMVQKSTAEQTAAKTAMDQMNAKVAASQQEMAGMKAKMDTMQGELAKMTETMTAQQAAVNAAVQAVQAAAAQVNRWKSEVEFVNQMASLEQQLAESEKLQVDLQAGLDAAKAALHEAQKKVDAAQQAKAAADQQTEAIVQQMQGIRGG